ncbi:hypothetical protein V5O48_006862 [Marasmius crinis-equi]|uniref:Uncharacterized protein n=1 Tax=Marasmius crinis-equi TaxID=585013 RepID=A0ABR3FIB6_9AGAR
MPKANKSLKTPSTSLSRKLAANRAINAGVLEKLGPIELALVRDYGSPWPAYIRRKGSARPPKKTMVPSYCPPDVPKADRKQEKKEKPRPVKVQSLRKNHKTWVSFQFRTTFLEFASKKKYVDGVIFIWRLFLEEHSDMAIPSSGCNEMDARNTYLQREEVRRALYRAGMTEYGYQGDTTNPLLDAISMPLSQDEYEAAKGHYIDPRAREWTGKIALGPFVKPRKLIF